LSAIGACTQVALIVCGLGPSKVSVEKLGRLAGNIL